MHTTTTSQNRYDLVSQEDRCAPRTRIAIPASLRPSGGKSFQTHVLDLSLGGFSAQCVNRMHVGSLTWLTLPGLESLQGEVVWWQDNIVGCAFQNLLSPIVHDNILARFRGEGQVRTC
jgi:hypothetical protein